jgi:hypothetical protein
VINEDWILDAKVVANGSQSWVALLVGEVEASCSGQVSGCFETLDCQCVYLPSLEVLRAAVRVVRLEDENQGFDIVLPAPLGSTRRVAVMVPARPEFDAALTSDGNLSVGLGSQIYDQNGNIASSIFEWLQVQPP